MTVFRTRAFATTCVADVRAAMGNLAEAVRLYELSEPIAAELAALAPTHAGFQNDLRITRARMSELRRAGTGD